MVSREDGILCGLALAEASFRLQDAGLRFTPSARDGDRISEQQTVARIEGNARSILAAERTALNFVCHLSGVASYTAQFVERVAHTKARICCTRKTLPGLRAFEKYAVRCGGGFNHRFGLDDAILIKDNHIAIAGGIAPSVEAARAYAGHLVAIEIEVDTLEQLKQALDAGANAVLLDNMVPEKLREAVAFTAGRAKLEASGGVTFDAIGDIAESGVDYISTSRITMAAPTLDLGLDIATNPGMDSPD